MSRPAVTVREALLELGRALLLARRVADGALAFDAADARPPGHAGPVAQGVSPSAIRASMSAMGQRRGRCWKRG